MNFGSLPWYIMVLKTIDDVVKEEYPITRPNGPDPELRANLLYRAREENADVNQMRQFLRSASEYDDNKNTPPPNPEPEPEPQPINSLRPEWGPVRIEAGDIFSDNTGPVYPIGCHFGEAFSAWCKGRKEDVRRQVRVIKQAGYSFIRVFTHLGYYDNVWAGREVTPFEFRNRSGNRVSPTPNYWGEFATFLRMLIEEGVRIGISPGDFNGLSWTQVRDYHILVKSTARAVGEQVIFFVELANEKFQNFPKNEAEDENLAVKIMNDAYGDTNWVKLNSCPPSGKGEEPSAFAEMVNKWFSSANVHGTRRFEDMEYVLRRHYNYGYERYPRGYSGKYGQISTEPGGPGSGVTVGNTSDTWKIVSTHLATLIGRSGTVYMSSNGVFWNGPIENQPGFWEVGSLSKIFPSNLMRFNSLHGNRGDAWVTSHPHFADRGEGYARVDQLVSGISRKGFALAHTPRGDAKVRFNQTCHVIIRDLSLNIIRGEDVYSGQVVKLGPEFGYFMEITL